MRSILKTLKKTFLFRSSNSKNIEIPASREYPRLTLLRPSEPLRAFPKTYILWPTTQQALAVFDLSYTGVAFQPPTNFQVNLSESVELELHIETNIVPITGHWVRKTDQVVAIRISHLNPEARRFLNYFFEEKIMAFHLVSVNARYFDLRKKNQTWLRGPSGTDIFLWTYKNNELEINSFEIRYLGSIFTYDGKAFKLASDANTLTFKDLRKTRLSDQLAQSDQDFRSDENHGDKFDRAKARSATWQKLIEMLELAVENHPILKTLILLIKNKNKEPVNGS